MITDLVARDAIGGVQGVCRLSSAEGSYWSEGSMGMVKADELAAGDLALRRGG